MLVVVLVLVLVLVVVVVVVLVLVDEVLVVGGPKHRQMHSTSTCSSG